MPSTRVEISETAVSPDHFIGGKRVSSPATFEVRSPLDWDWHLAEVAVAIRSPPIRRSRAAVDAFPGLGRAHASAACRATPSPG